MRIARKLALITLSTLVAAPLLALPEGVVQGTVDCGKRCHKHHEKCHQDIGFFHTEIHSICPTCSRLRISLGMMTN